MSGEKKNQLELRQRINQMFSQEIEVDVLKRQNEAESIIRGNVDFGDLYFVSNKDESRSSDC